MASLVIYPENEPPYLLPLPEDSITTIGRHPESVLLLDSPSVSSQHAQLAPTDEGWSLQDLGSSNGTRVNGAPIEEALLMEGDRVTFGDMQALFYLSDEAAADALEPVQAAVPTPDSLPPPALSKAPLPSQATPKPPVTKPKLPAERLKKVGRSYPGSESEGCTSSIIIAAILFGAIALGLWLRHSNETGGNFFSDAFRSLFGGMPSIKIETRAE
jgi:hypothetical protein